MGNFFSDLVSNPFSLLGLGTGAVAGALGLGKKGDKYSAPSAPMWEQQIPESLQSYFPDMVAYLNSLKGQQLQMPTEYGQAGDYLSNYLNNPPSFNYPMEDIMKALEAQQALQQQDYLNQLRPLYAQQGQLDSSAYTNAIGKYMQGQQSTSYNRIADLLTQQALTNLGIQQTLPGVAQGLSGIGTQKAGIEQFNLNQPYQSYIPAMNILYNQGMNYATNQYGSEMVPYQQEMEIQLANKAASQAQQQQLMGMLGSLGLTAVTGGLGGLLGGTGFMAGAGGALTNLANPSYLNLSNMFSQGGQTLSPQLQSLTMNTPSSVYNPSWGNYNNLSYSGLSR